MMRSIKEGVGEDKVKALIAGLNELKKVIPGMLDVSGGYNNSPEGKSSGFNYGFIVKFKDSASRDGYVPHPEHIRLAQTLVRPIIDDVIVLDYEH